MTPQHSHRKKPQRRGAVCKDTSKLISLWIPTDSLNVLDNAIRREDTDRSKFIRRAIQDALANHSN